MGAHRAACFLWSLVFNYAVDFFLFGRRQLKLTSKGQERRAFERRSIVVWHRTNGNVAICRLLLQQLVHFTKWILFVDIVQIGHLHTVYLMSFVTSRPACLLSACALFWCYKYYASSLYIHIYNNICFIISIYLYKSAFSYKTVLFKTSVLLLYIVSNLFDIERMKHAKTPIVLDLENFKKKHDYYYFSIAKNS